METTPTIIAIQIKITIEILAAKALNIQEELTQLLLTKNRQSLTERGFCFRLVV